MTLQCWMGDKVTVLVSKTAGRYRVQADSFEVLGWIVEVRWVSSRHLRSSVPVACKG